MGHRFSFKHYIGLSIVKGGVGLSCGYCEWCFANSKEGMMSEEVSFLEIGRLIGRLNLAADISRTAMQEAEKVLADLKLEMEVWDTEVVMTQHAVPLGYQVQGKECYFLGYGKIRNRWGFIFRKRAMMLDDQDRDVTAIEGVDLENTVLSEVVFPLSEASRELLILSSRRLPEFTRLIYEQVECLFDELLRVGGPVLEESSL